LQCAEITENRELQKLQTKLSSLLAKLGKHFTESILQGFFNMRTLIYQLQNSDLKEDRVLAGEYYGIVADIFEVREDLYVPLSSVLGKKLYSHLIKNFKTMERLTAKFKEANLKGTLHFISIENIKIAKRPVLKVIFKIFYV
jgi:hypothetical protein